MKRSIICLMLLAAMLAGMMSVHAAEAEITVQVRASETEVQVGDTVEFTVLATGSGVVAMQFNLMLPEGLSYVPNSGKTPDRLAQKLGVPAADWTEQSRMFTFYNDVGITFANGTEIVSFSCVAEKEGTWEVELYELLPFNGDFEEFEPKLQVQKVTVTGTQTQTQPQPSVPAIGETIPAEPDKTQPTGPADKPETQTQPVINTDPAEDEVATDTVTENTQQAQGGVIFTEPKDPEEKPEQNQQAESEEEPEQDEQAKDEEPQDEDIPPRRVFGWIVPVGVVVLVAGCVVVLILIRKKSA